MSASSSRPHRSIRFARQTVSVQNRGRDGLPDQLFPQGVRHKFGLIQLAECVAFRHGNHVRIRHAGG